MSAITDPEIIGCVIKEVSLNSCIVSSDVTGGRLWVHYNTPEERQSVLTCLSKVDDLELMGDSALHYSKEILTAEAGGCWSFNNTQISGGFPLVKNFFLNNVCIQGKEDTVQVYSLN